MRRVPPEMFRFTTGDRADLYGAILQAFGAANERLETALGLDDVRARLRTVGWLDAIHDDDLQEALRKLREWQLLDVVQNHAENYRTADEYERRNLQYSLTRRGEAAFAGVEHALSVLASTGALRTAVLEAVTDRLDELYVLLGESASPDRAGSSPPCRNWRGTWRRCWPTPRRSTASCSACCAPRARTWRPSAR